MSSPRISRRRTKRVLLALVYSSAIFLLLLLQLLSAKTTTESPVHLLARRHLQEHAVAHSACESTLYPQLCVSTLLSVPDLASKRVPELISITINRTLSELRASSSNCSAIRRSYTNLTTLEATAIDDCLELFDDTIAELKSALSDLSPSPNKKPLSPSPARRHYHDLQTLFSGAMTNQYTCLDGFAYSDGDVRDEIKFSLYNISRHVSNSLVMLKKVNGVQVHSKNGKNEVFPEYGGVSKRGFPTWLSLNDRKLLQKAVNETKFNLIVAKDGTRNFTTISEAVAAAPNKTNTRFVIYIKAGAYFENVEVDRNKAMLMFLGDGIGKTIVKAGRNVVDGWTTFRSATVAVVGNGFIAKGITFENSAGPSKHQAVALRSGSDLSAFYQCSFVGYQDTLYVHSLRQFYRECDIYGTVDFVFGNAAVVFQNCNLYARKPDDRQKNIITAQGREDPNQNTGISILNCKVAAASDLLTNQSAFKTYLGRPWKEYSRTVYMLSHIGDLIEPAGWLEWNGTFALSTLFYGEYKNRGPGSNTSARVPWPGYRVINDSAVANQFTADSFLQGREWLNATGVPFYLNLTASM